MLEPDGCTSTAHSVNPVGLIVTARGVELAESGKLADVAPTILALLKIQRPSLVSGHSLLAS
jgi:2,3-bisphosphoglycerate-independent phosphoglycerate mutase